MQGNAIAIGVYRHDNHVQVLQMFYGRLMTEG
jgi:hypothetical protein